MARVAFAARLGHPSTRTAGPWSVVVTNPFTGKPLALDRSAIVNRVDAVVAVSFSTAYSGRQKKITPGHVELVNPYTGNTFLVHRSALIKENP